MNAIIFTLFFVIFLFFLVQLSFLSTKKKKQNKKHHFEKLNYYAAIVLNSLTVQHNAKVNADIIHPTYTLRCSEGGFVKNAEIMSRETDLSERLMWWYTLRAKELLYFIHSNIFLCWLGEFGLFKTKKIFFKMIFFFLLTAYQVLRLKSEVIYHSILE